MKKNEYGSIQQHLEPSHIRKLLIPLPDSLNEIKELIELGKEAVLAQEVTYEKDSQTTQSMSELLSSFGIISEDLTVDTPNEGRP